jgi:hypothetical protein
LNTKSSSGLFDLVVAALVGAIVAGVLTLAGSIVTLNRQRRLNRKDEALGGQRAALLAMLRELEPIRLFVQHQAFGYWVRGKWVMPLTELVGEAGKAKRVPPAMANGLVAGGSQQRGRRNRSSSRGDPVEMLQEAYFDLDDMDRAELLTGVRRRKSDKVSRKPFNELTTALDWLAYSIRSGMDSKDRPLWPRRIWRVHPRLRRKNLLPTIGDFGHAQAVMLILDAQDVEYRAQAMQDWTLNDEGMELVLTAEEDAEYRRRLLRLIPKVNPGAAEAGSRRRTKMREDREEDLREQRRRQEEREQRAKQPSISKANDTGAIDNGSEDDQAT